MITLDIKEFKDNIKSLEDVSVRKHTGGIQYLYDTIYSAIINGKYTVSYTHLTLPTKLEV